MKTVVTKFGGTSLADANQFKKVKKIIESNPERRFVVASAPGKRFDKDIKITDLLYACIEASVQGENYAPILKKIAARFNEIISELQVDIDITEDIEAISKHLEGNPSRAYMASRGEYLNSKILASYLGYSFLDPLECIHFDEDGKLEKAYTYGDLRKELSKYENAVIAGFYGAGPEGEVVTFSRGGSDITGSLVAKAVKADLYENWTDVSGLLAADPRIIDNPRVVEYISYRELRILSYMGASVLHTDAVYPASSSGIPINIRNTNQPEDPGTMIVSQLPKDRTLHTITGVAGRKGMTVVQVEKMMVSDEAGFTAVILDIFRAYGVPFEQCLTGIDIVTVIVRSDLFRQYKDKLLKSIRAQLKPDTLILKEDLAMITVVGEEDADYIGSMAHIIGAISQAGIELSTINQGAGSLSLIVGVREEDYESAVKAAYYSIQ